MPAMPKDDFESVLRGPFLLCFDGRGNSEWKPASALVSLYRSQNLVIAKFGESETDHMIVSRQVDEATALAELDALIGALSGEQPNG